MRKYFRAGVGLLSAFMVWALSSCGGTPYIPTPDSPGSVGIADSSPGGTLPVSEPENTTPAPPEPTTTVHMHIFVGATCTEAGKCECGAEDEALGHDFSESTCTVPATCKRCGATNGKALGHHFAAETCTEPSVCTRCGVQGKALGHDFAAATCTAPSTCKRCGVTGGNALGHSYSGGKCKKCGDTNGPLKPEEAKLFKNRLTDEENAQALAVARELVRQIEAELPDGSDLDRISMAAQLVSAEYSKGVHLESGNYYHTAYGVFVKRESSCAGCCRALGLVLSCMGYQWKHINENQWQHQWVTVTVNGETFWADGQVGWSGTGQHPMA